MAAGDHVLALSLAPRRRRRMVDGGAGAALVALYPARLEDRPSPLPPLTVHYADYAAWQREWLRGETLEAHLHWWREQLTGAPAILELPTDRPRPPAEGERGARIPITVDLPTVTRGLRALARQTDATLFMALLGAFAALLPAASADLDDVVIGTPVTRRTQVETEGPSRVLRQHLGAPHRPLRRPHVQRDRHPVRTPPSAPTPTKTCR